MCTSLKPPKQDKAALRAQREEAERQRNAEQDRVRRDKNKQLSSRRGGGVLRTVQSLVSFTGAPVGGGASGRSFFSGTGGGA